MGPKEIEIELAKIKGINQLLLKSVQATQKHEGFGLFSSTLYALGAYKRHLGNCAAFENMIGTRIFGVAATILRMQIDIPLRLYGLTLVDDLDSKCLDLLGGKIKYSHLKDKNNNSKLTDAYLVGQLNEHYDWLKRVYSNTSGYVHLSEKHFQTLIVSTGENESSLTFSGVIGPSDDHIPTSAFHELTQAFVEATHMSAFFLDQFFLSCINPAYQS